ncbi:hypothetical protein QQF64_036337 [Cirrhinus molitorella]|uniref:Uncharacterized protein n=1 Tax=Cirrhinus molitorella TaxID=172907 RepID=A0ABR3NIH1_9TELE
MMEGGARETTGGSRVDQPEGGARVPGETQAAVEMAPTVEPTEGGAMVEEGLTTPGGWPTVAEQVVVESEAETESQRSGVTPRIRRAKVEQMAPVTEAEAEIWRAAVEPERSRTEAQPEEWSPEAMAG